MPFLPLPIDSTTSFNFAATNSGSFTRGRQNSSPSCSSAYLHARSERDSSTVLYIHALLIRLFFSFFLSSCVNLGFYFFSLYIEGFFEILIIRYSVVFLCLSVISFLLSLPPFLHGKLLRSSAFFFSFVFFSFRFGREGRELEEGEEGEKRRTRDTILFFSPCSSLPSSVWKLRYRCLCLIHTLNAFLLLSHSRGRKESIPSLPRQDKTSNSDSLPHTLPQALSITVPILAIQRVTAATTITTLKYFCYYYYSYCCCYQYYYLLSSFHCSTPPPPLTPSSEEFTQAHTHTPHPASIFLTGTFASCQTTALTAVPFHTVTSLLEGGRSIRGDKGEKKKDSLSIFIFFYLPILFIYIFNLLLCSQNKILWKEKDKKNPSPPLPSPHCLPRLVPQIRAKRKATSEQCQASLAVVGNHRDPTTSVNRTIVVVKPQTRVPAEVTAVAATTPTAAAVVRSQPSMEAPTGTLRLLRFLAPLLPLLLLGPPLLLPTLPLLALQLQSHIRTNPRSSNCLRPPTAISNTTYHVFSAVTG